MPHNLAAAPGLLQVVAPHQSPTRLLRPQNRAPGGQATCNLSSPEALFDTEAHDGGQYHHSCQRNGVNDNRSLFVATCSHTELEAARFLPCVVCWGVQNKQCVQKGEGENGIAG